MVLALLALACPGDATVDTDVDTEAPAAGCGALDAEDNDPLPDQIWFRTPTRSFNQRWFAALQDGRIWVKPVSGEEPWSLLDGDGLPNGPNLDNFGAPSRIAEISVDGVHLHAISEEGRFYRGSDMTTDITHGFVWTDGWGGIGGAGPGMATQFSTRCGWSVSDSHPFGVENYEDPNGTVHSVGLGVAHVYRLSGDGRTIRFNDWWLPPDWSRQICGPERGTFQAINLSVSASTMFVVGADGALYTRLYDFDTGGENSLLTYSYIVGAGSGTTRKLAAEGWVRQPEITDGRITARITIFQDGEGNGSRVLRVEGERSGHGGIFTKRIFDAAWTFQAGDPVSGPFLDPNATPITAAPDDFALDGTLSLGGRSVGIQLLDLNLVCSPARAHLTIDGRAVTADGLPLELAFHHVSTMVDETRPMNFRDQAIPDAVQAALIVPDLRGVDDADARAALQDLFGGKEVIDLLGTISRDKVKLTEIMWTQPFRVPANEKAFWSGFDLVAD